MFYDEVTNLENLANSRMGEMAEKQASLEEKLDTIQKEVKNISVDIYGEDEDDGEYSLTIACPYCNSEFTIDVDEIDDEVTCPECKQIIELDWGHECDEDDCSGCGHHCHHDDDEDDDM